MSKIKLNLDLHQLEPHQVAAFVAFVTSFNTKSTLLHVPDPSQIPTTAELVETKELEQAAPVPKRTSRAKAKQTETTSEAFEDKQRTESVVDQHQANEVEQEVEAPAIQGAPESVTLDEIRELITPAILENSRKELKDKIVELGGTKVADLPTEAYPALKAFLKQLK